MFDELAQSGPTPAQQALTVLAGAIRTPWSRRLIGVGSLLVGASGFGGSFAAHAVGPDPCMDLRQAQFTIDELIGTKDKVLAYEAEPEGELALSGKEVSFVLADNLKFPVWVETRGDELFVQAALPVEPATDEAPRCWNVEFQGAVTVAGGQATVVPTALTVGHLPLSLLVAGRRFDVAPTDLEASPSARQLLEQVVRLSVASDEVLVSVRDPRSLRSPR